MVGTLARPLFDGPSGGTLRFLLLSLALHAAVLFLMKPFSVDPPAQESLTVTLSPRSPTPVVASPVAPTPAQASAVVARHAEHPVAMDNHPTPTASMPTPAPETPTIDLDAAFSAARTFAREPQPRTNVAAPKPLLTVEAAVARATEPDLMVESRGANGERVMQNRKTRCVARLQRKWFEEGTPMLPLCEAKKG